MNSNDQGIGLSKIAFSVIYAESASRKRFFHQVAVSIAPSVFGDSFFACVCIATHPYRCLPKLMAATRLSFMASRFGCNRNVPKG